jgi:predicted TIM-barrel fold metal-dependent hydrolase
MTDELPKIISVDDHVIEPSHLFERWLPKKFHESGPHPVRTGIGDLRFVAGKYEYVTDPEGQLADWWFYEKLKAPYRRNIAASGFDPDDMTLDGITYDEMRPGCYDPKARLDDMDQNWVEASLCFPTFPRFCGQTFLEADDKETALACVRAYNDWMVEEWCGESGGRLIPLIIIPLWDPGLAAAEIHRNAARGVHAVCFSEMPSQLGLPSIHTDYWDPFFAACNDTATTINMHIGSSSSMPRVSPDAPVATGIPLSFSNSMASMCDWVFSGKLNTFRDLKLAYSEGQIGWIPYVLERMDDVWRQHRAWGGVKDIVKEPPSLYYHRHMYGCFFRDKHGMRSLEEIGADSVTFEVDYPHVDSTWPHTRGVAEEMTADLDVETRYKVLRGNAIKMLSLEGLD